MKITLDTNVLISATFWKGDADKIIEKVERKELELVLSKEIIEEYARVLNYKEIQDKVKNKNLEMRRSVEKIVSLSTVVEPTEKVSVVKNDTDDDKILECAKAGKVDVIVSNDNHLLDLKEFEKIKIINPKEFISSNE